MIFIILVLLISIIFFLHYNNISVYKLLFSNKLKEHFLITVKDRQKIGTVDSEDGQQPKSTWKAGNRNYETCYSTETRNGNTTGRYNTYYCNQGVDSGEVIPAEGLYSLDMSNYTVHPGKALRGKPLTGIHNRNNGRAYSLNSDGTVMGENALTLAQSKSFCDSLKGKCKGFIMIIPTKGAILNTKTVFLSEIDEGWEDPDTYIKMQDFDETNTNIVSYVKKDVNATEKAIPQNKINQVADKYKNLPTCNWKSANRCIFRDYSYDQSNNSCRSKDGLAYDVSLLNSYTPEVLNDWLKQLYNRDMGVNKLASEAVNVHEFVDRCKDLDGYEFLGSVSAPNPYVPPPPGTVKGRYVRISLNNRQLSDNWLQLAEVQVISNNRNIAMNKTTSSSGNYPGSANSKANDSNNDGNWNAGSVYHSGNGTWDNDGGPQFWEVDLGDANQTIDRIIVSNRTDCCGNRLSNWLLSIYDYNKNLIWARIYRDPPSPRINIDISQATNDMANVRIKDYNRSRFNNYFYRVSDTEYNSKRGWDGKGCYDQCHKEICESEKKKWIGNNDWYGCRDYRPGEWEAEEAERKRLEALNKYVSIPENTPHMVAYRGQFAKIYKINVVGTTSGGTVWGDTNYTDDSDIRRAAVHAGVIRIGERKTLYIQMLPGQGSYSGNTKNSISTSPYGSWGGTYRFVDGPPANFNKSTSVGNAPNVKEFVCDRNSNDRLVSAEVRSGAWMDGIKLNCSSGKSEKFGGNGGGPSGTANLGNSVQISTSPNNMISNINGVGSSWVGGTSTVNCNSGNLKGMEVGTDAGNNYIQKLTLLCG
jgi:hypothetical protein